MTDVQIIIVVVTSTLGLIALYLAWRLVAWFFRLLFGIPKPKRRRRVRRTVNHALWGQGYDSTKFGIGYWYETDPYGMVPGNPYNDVNVHSPYLDDNL
jgi:hypothetical protein